MKYEDIEVGMLLKSTGLVLSKEDTSEGVTLISIDYNDPFYGSMSHTADKDTEFSLMFEKGSSEYIEIVANMVVERREYIRDAEADIAALREILKSALN